MRTLATLFAVSAALMSSTALADVNQMRSTALSWLVLQQKGDGSFPAPAGLEIQATAAAAEAMRAGGLSASPSYARAISWLANQSALSTDSRARQGAALANAGRDVSALAARLVSERDGTAVYQGTNYSGFAIWGPYANFGNSTVDTILALGLLREAGYAYSASGNEFAQTVECWVLPNRLSASPWTNSWTHAPAQTNQPSGAATGSTLATALVVYEVKQSLLSGRFTVGYCGANNATVETAMVNAKTWLIAQANGDGGFAQRRADTGVLEASNPVLTALSVRALSLYANTGDSAASAAVTKAQNWLDTIQQANGSWAGDPFITARVLAALPVASGAQATDTDLDGLTDVVETELGTNVNVADAQSVLATNAQATSGLTASAFSVNAALGEPFAYTLGASGGTGPYNFVIAGGALPPGLTLAANGTISGTPSSTGRYAFDYRITDGNGDQALVIGRVDVSQALAADDGDVPLPAWALALLGGAMLTAMRKQRG